MKLVKLVLLALFALPALELAGFLLIALFIGWFWAGLLLVASSLLGIRLLRKFGRRDLDRVRGALASDGLQAIHLDDPAVARIAGALLLAVPGFITDAFGAALFIPPLRRRIAGVLASARSRPARAQDKVVDLTPAEWSQDTSERRGDGDSS